MTNIGIQASSVREYLQSSADVFKAFQKLSDIGYRTIQIQWISPEVPIQDIKEALDKAQLKCIGTQDYYEVVTSHLDEVIQMNELWGGTDICVSGIPEEYRSRKGCKKFAEELNRIAKKLGEANKTLTFHPRSQDILFFEDGNSLDFLFNYTDERVQFGLDIYHIIDANLDPVEWIYKLEGRMEWVHFKDYKMDSNGGKVLTPVGQGLTDWEAITAACNKTNVKYAFAEQERWEKEAFESMEDSFEYMATLNLEE